MDNLRTKLIRLAATLPKGSDRQALLDVLAIEDNGTASPDEMAKKLAELKKVVQGAGKVLSLVADSSKLGGGWVATVDTEWAALRLYREYNSANKPVEIYPHGSDFTVRRK